VKHAQRGTSTAEFAIAATLMLMVVFGIIQFGKAIYAYHSVANAARLGSRWAMVRGSDCVAATCPATAATVKAYVQSQMPLLNSAAATVTTTWSTSSGCYGNPSNGPGCVVAVTVSYPFHFDVPLVSSAVLQISSTSQMVISE